MNTSTAVGAAAGAYEESLAVELSEHLSSSTGVPHSVTGVVRLAGGVSHETWSFDAFRDDSKGGVEPFILRLDLDSVVLGADTASEFNVLTELHRLGIPVPKPHSRSHSRHLRAGFLISERLKGTDLRKALASTSSPGRSTGEDCVEVLARIHDTETVNSVRHLGELRENLEIYVERWLGQAHVGADRLPIIPAAVDWLQRNFSAPHRETLVHGDFKANNILMCDGRPFVLDWELTHIGDPLEDLAWTLMWTTSYDLVGGLLTREEFLNGYVNRIGRDVDPESLAYWEVFALVKLAAIFIMQGTQLAQATVSPTLRLMGRALPALEHRLAAKLADNATKKRVIL